MATRARGGGAVPSTTSGRTDLDAAPRRTTATILRALAGGGRLAGIGLTEHVPALDVRQLTLLTMTRLLLSVIGNTARAHGSAPGVVPPGPR